MRQERDLGSLAIRLLLEAESGTQANVHARQERGAHFVNNLGNRQPPGPSSSPTPCDLAQVTYPLTPASSTVRDAGKQS